MLTLNLGGSQITAPLTAQQAAALESALNQTVGSLPGVSGISIGSVQVSQCVSITPAVLHVPKTPIAEHLLVIRRCILYCTARTPLLHRSHEHGVALAVAGIIRGHHAAAGSLSRLNMTHSLPSQAADAAIDLHTNAIIVT